MGLFFLRNIRLEPLIGVRPAHAYNQFFGSPFRNTANFQKCTLLSGNKRKALRHKHFRQFGEGKGSIESIVRHLLNPPVDGRREQIRQ